MARRTTRALAPIALIGAIALVGCASGGGDADAELGTEDNPVQFGVVGASEAYWPIYEQAVEDAGISIDIVDFTDYAQPNPALSEGELDINQFQHIIYLADYNTSAGDDLVPIGSTAAYPLSLYSTQYESVDDIPDGATVAVPNDTTNQARGLLVLQSAGLIELKDGGSPYSTLADIEDSSRVEVTALDAAATPSSLPDVAAAIINNDFVTDAGLTPEDALFSDDPADPASQPYINIFATRAELKDDAVLAQLVEIWQTNQDVLDAAQEAAGGSAVFVQTPVDELQASLDETEEAAQG